jgi:hypothetical protein
MPILNPLLGRHLVGELEKEGVAAVAPQLLKKAALRHSKRLQDKIE